VDVDRDAATVVRHRDTAVLMDRDRDDLAEATDRFIDGVVHDLVDEVMEALGTRRPYVHRGTFSNGIEAFEDLD
jgi:hypothetical protein